MADSFTATSPTGMSFSSPAEWYDQYLADLTALGGTLAQEEYVPYGGPRIAEYNADQQRAFAMTRDAMDMWKPYVDPALESLNAARGGLNAMNQLTAQSSVFDRPTFEGTFLDIYMDPARKAQEAARSIGERNFENTTLKQLSDEFTGTGQFGSGRHQILGADAAANAQAQIEEAAATIGLNATTNAMSDYYKWGQQGLQGASQYADYSANSAKLGTDLMNFGLGTQQAAMADAAAIGNVGQQQQTMDQQNMNLAYQDFQDQQAYPWQQLDKWAALTRGQTMPNYTSNVSLPAATPTTSVNPWLSGAQGAATGWLMGSAFS